MSVEFDGQQTAFNNGRKLSSLELCGTSIVAVHSSGAGSTVSSEFHQNLF